MPLRFHWSLSQAGDRWRKTLAPAAQSGVPNLPAHVEYCRCAERNGRPGVFAPAVFDRDFLGRTDSVAFRSTLDLADGDSPG